MLNFIFLILLTSCAHRMNLSIDGVRSEAVTSEKKEKYWVLYGAEDALRKTPAATLAVAFNLKDKVDRPQDIIGFSVGTTGKSTFASRASIRVNPEGRLRGMARSIDSEIGQNMLNAEKVVKTDTWHHVVLTIDYTKNEMLLYLDGKLVDSKGIVKFSAPETADTPSKFVTLGAEEDGSTYFFDGEIQSPMVWRRKLSKDEVQGLALSFKESM